ncbi:hypothetical protein NM688_g87 [Phlebia brevispora]|uniref:Uncharacterized protein n=1 Tax=Phlebia brevispora TaxID=194682 RepID=A0ACC1TFN1_9APHY|nr:hypothetical protein NM688_g87 [Phlebia brevispora]
MDIPGVPDASTYLSSDVAYLAVITHIIYFYIATNYANSDALLIYPWTNLTFIAFSVSSGLIVREVYTFRIHRHKFLDVYVCYIYSTDTILWALSLHAISSGFLTCVLEFLTLITFVVWAGNNIYNVFLFLLPALLSAMLVSLKSREKIRGQCDAPLSTIVIPATACGSALEFAMISKLVRLPRDKMEDQDLVRRLRLAIQVAEQYCGIDVGWCKTWVSELSCELIGNLQTITHTSASQFVFNLRLSFFSHGIIKAEQKNLRPYTSSPRTGAFIGESLWQKSIAAH